MVTRIETSSARFRIVAQGTLRQVQQRIVDTAKRESAKIMNGDPKPSSFQRYVDGVKGAPEEGVKPFGIIVYQFSYIEEVISVALDAVLPNLSPVDSGTYETSHKLFVDGVEVDFIPYRTRLIDLPGWHPGAELSIANYVAYARKIELGKMKMRVPGTDHVYRQAEQTLRRRYGNLASFKFTFRGISEGGVIRGKVGNASFMRFPALIIKER